MRQGSNWPADANNLSALAGRCILFVVPDLAGDAGEAIIDLASALSDCGARALVACQGGALVSELQVRGGLYLPFPAKSTNPLAMAFHVRRLARLMAEQRIDLVDARSRGAAWVAYGATQFVRRPLVTAFRGVAGPVSPLRRPYESVMFRGDRIIAYSHYAARQIEWDEAAPSEKVRVIARPVDLRRFSPLAVGAGRVQALRRQWGVAPEERIVLMPARFDAAKGHAILIEAASQMAKQGMTGVRFMLLGDEQRRGAHGKDLDRQIKQRGLGAIVERQPPAVDRAAALLAAAVVVLPATGDELFNSTAAEAAAMGTPLVVSKSGALAEMVQAVPDVSADRRTGWRVAKGDAVALATALTEALAMGVVQREALSERARALVEDWHSSEHMCRETLGAYAELLASPPLADEIPWQRPFDTDMPASLA